MKIGAWIVCQLNGCRQAKLRRQTLRMIHWSLNFFYSILDEQSLCKILKVYDNEGVEILILILNLEMENTAINLGKHLFVI
jgi:hypothetical protein